MSEFLSIANRFHSLVQRWTSSNAFDSALSSAFESAATERQLLRLRNLLRSPEISVYPRVVELNPEYLKNHFAAFSAETNTIYVDPDLKSFPGLTERVLAHELGHWVDYQVHGEFTSHTSVQLFAASLIGRDVDLQVKDGHSPDQYGVTDEIMLPSGDTVDAQFFNTSTHITWIAEQLPFLSTSATQLIENAQKDTDWFNASSYSSFGPLKYSPYGLQTHAPSHFDNNNISGGLSAIRSRWSDGINRFNASSILPATSEQFLGRNAIDALANPAFIGLNAGIQLLLYRFGQINHAFEDFYSHSNWVELSQKGLIASSRLLDGGLTLPVVLRPGDQISGTDVYVAQDGPDWSNILIKSGTGSYSFRNYDVYWNVDSTNPAGGGGIVSATTIDGRRIYGLATGATNGALYKDRDFSVFLRDPSKTGTLRNEYFRGFDHGGIAGTLYGQWVGPLNKDSDSNPNFLSAKKLANLQLQNEWDRMGNLIFNNYGVEGLRRFANFALATQDLVNEYVTTFSTPGARYFSTPAALNLSSPLSLSTYGAQGDALTQTADIPEIRLVRLFGAEFYDPAEPFSSYQDRYQFRDSVTGLWLDTAFNDISIHHELELDEIVSLTTPSQTQHAASGQRAVWSSSRQSSINDSATNYFVETINPEVDVFIDDFDLNHDRVVLVESSGDEVQLPEYLYSFSKVNQLTVELAKYRIHLNFRPETTFSPGVLLIRESQLAAPVVIEASRLSVDVQGDNLFFTGYDESIPFLELVDGALRASFVDPRYAGRTYTAYVDISDGVSIARSVSIRIAVAPELVIAGQAFDSETPFRLTFNSTTQQSFEIFAQVSDHLNETLDLFLPIATSIGYASGSPVGYEAMEKYVKLTDNLDSGSVSFWYKDDSSGLRQLVIASLTSGGFNLLLDGVQVAQLSPIDSALTAPEISQISCTDIFDDGLGIRLNQSFVDAAPRDISIPWSVSLSIDLFREASYTSQVGLFLFDRSSGGIVDPLTGISLDSSSSSWAQDAMRYAIWTGATENMKSSSFTTTFQIVGSADIDSLALMPFMKTQIEFQEYYFSSFGSLNPDEARHIAALSRNVFGFEDKLGLGDNDLDDMVLRVNSMTLM